MSFVGVLLKAALRWHSSRNKQQDPCVAQLRLLRYLLNSASSTQFGRAYGFSRILDRFPDLSYDQVASSEVLAEAHHLFSAHLPVYSYEEIYEEWWKKLKGSSDLCWPGRVTRFALSSGTSMNSSKYIPVSREMLHQMRAVIMQQLSALLACDLSAHLYTGEVLFLSGNTALQPKGATQMGDISAILAEQMPLWSFLYARTSARMVRVEDWEEKLDTIVKKAERMNVTAVVGAPVWVQLLLHRILDRYGLEHIHQIWPHFRFFVHGGMSITPYQSTLKRLFGEEIHYLETYLASEGFIAYQAHPSHSSMQLSFEAGLFYEFVPYEGRYATSSDIASRAISISEVELNRPYELILSNCSGLWRYRIGDVIVFQSLNPLSISIEGRTSAYLSLCGEHLCLSNLEEAIASVSRDLQTPLREFMVFGRRKGREFEHLWHLGIDNGATLDSSSVAHQIDTYLQSANTDYSLQRKMNLLPPQVDALPIDYFYDWMKKQGKWGKQHKVPRVLKSDQLQSWLVHLRQYTTDHVTSLQCVFD